MAEAPGILLLDAEDNDLSGFTITEEGSNDLTISSGAALHGSLGYEFSFSGNTGENLLYFYKSFTADSDIYARCYFYIPSGFGGTTGYFFELSLFSGTTELLSVSTYWSHPNLQLRRFRYYTNSGTAYTLPAVSLSLDALYCIEIRYKSGNGDGVVEFWINEVQVAIAENLTNNNYSANRIIVGNSSGGCVPTSGSVIYIDDIKVDSSYIGAYAESGGALPAIINNYRQQGVM